MKNTIPRISNFFICLIYLLAYSQFANAQVERVSLKVLTVATNLGIPWGMALLPDGNTLLVTQREGILSKINLSTGIVQNISGGFPDIKVKGQSGLFDIALSPHYDSNGWIYFTYTKDVSGQAVTTLSKAHIKANTLSDWQDVLITQSRSHTSAHFGGRISFDNDDHLFLSVGDRGIRSNAQDLSNHAGKILRINLDGTIPKDNPFVNDPQVRHEIWSYGHRNPQGLFFNSQTQKLWAIEHGPRGGDEINEIKPSHNYGWPIISYGREYNQNTPVGEGTHREGMQQPIKTYIPSIAPSGLIQYSGNLFPAWKGDFLTGSLKLRHLNHVVLDKHDLPVDELRFLRNINGRIRNIIEAPNGQIYVSTDDGRILMISPQ